MRAYDDHESSCPRCGTGLPEGDLCEHVNATCARCCPLDHNVSTPARVIEPGIYWDMPAATYHAQTDWLSWSGMKHLIPPLTPAHFKAAQGAPEERKRAFDLGKVVHHLVLGDGDQFEVVQALDKQKQPYDAADYSTVSARADRDRIYGEGRVPILRHELEQAEAMAEQVRRHPTASRLFVNGDAEVSLFWVDPGTGVKCRARLDWLPELVDGQVLVVPDLKTTAASAAPQEFARAAANFGYYGQSVHYSDGVQALTGQRPAFLFVAVETAAPHLVGVCQLTDREDLRLARGVVDHCRRLYGECVRSGRWPGHSDDVADLHLPQWLHYNLEEVVA